MQWLPFFAAITLLFSTRTGCDEAPSFLHAVLSEVAGGVKEAYSGFLPTDWRLLIENWDDVRPKAEFCLGATQQDAGAALSRTIPEPLPTDDSDPICSSITSITPYLCDMEDLGEYYNVSAHCLAEPALQYLLFV